MRQKELSTLELDEFRKIRFELFRDKKTQGVEVTPEIKANPLFKRYSQLAPKFYVDMLRERRRLGLRT